MDGNFGGKFGRLTVIGKSSKRNRRHAYKWVCHCDCGNETLATKQALLEGKKKSCGCLKQEKETRFGEISGNYWYSLQSSAMRRGYKLSITIKEAWDLFRLQMGLCAISGEPIKFGENQTASLDRIDNKLDYVHGNVWWVHKDVNRLKSNWNLVDFYNWCKKIANYEPVDEIRKCKWDRRFLDLAKHIAGWSKDPSTQVGAVICDDNYRIISVGFNGFPQGIMDNPDKLNNRDIKYKMTVHAEINAIIFADRDLSGCTLITWPFQPCSRCAAMVIQGGITRCVAPAMPDHLRERWGEDMALAAQMFIEAGVKLELAHEEI